MKGIDIKLLRAFITLADAGSYHHAAQTLFITQPALSKQIKALEQLTGGALFQRGRNGASLTLCGARLYPKATAFLQSHLIFMRDAQEICQQTPKKLTLGFGISSFHTVPAWINQFRQQFSDCEVIINPIPSSLQTKMLLEGSLDIGFIRLPAAELLTTKIIHTEQLILAVPSDSHIQSDNIQHGFLSYPLLQLDPATHPCLAAQTAQLLKHFLSCTTPISATADMATLLALIAGGNGIAILPESVRHFLPAEVRLVALSQNPIHWDIGAVWNAKIDNPRRDDFLQIVDASASVKAC